MVLFILSYNEPCPIYSYSWPSTWKARKTGMCKHCISDKKTYIKLVVTNPTLNQSRKQAREKDQNSNPMLHLSLCSYMTVHFLLPDHVVFLDSCSTKEMTGQLNHNYYTGKYVAAMSFFLGYLNWWILEQEDFPRKVVWFSYDFLHVDVVQVCEYLYFLKTLFRSFELLSKSLMPSNLIGTS